MAGYTYKGALHDLSEPWPELSLGRATAKSVAECGTVNGYAAHRRWGEEICQPCRAAQMEAQRKRRASQKSAA